MIRLSKAVTLKATYACPYSYDIYNCFFLDLVSASLSLLQLTHLSNLTGIGGARMEPGTWTVTLLGPLNS